MSALPPATLEGWYSLHQVFELDFPALRGSDESQRDELVDEAHRLLADLRSRASEGWSDAFRLAGGGADLMFVHFRPSLEEIAEVQLAVKRSALADVLHLRYDYLAVTEAGLYHATAQVAKEHEPHSEGYQRALAEEAAAEAASPHIQMRLFPRPPEDMRFISFYPMSKRRTQGDNWYSLPVEDRNRLMREHGMTGRRYARRVFQIICGSVGLDDWEWGVTLFTRDPLEFKRIVTEMRYDEASARYGEFGSFYTGIRLSGDEWPRLLGAG
jgi:hydrogen peroxide-dependent heme synthase